MEQERSYLVVNAIPDSEHMFDFRQYLSKIIPLFNEYGGKPLGRYKTVEQVIGQNGFKAFGVFEFKNIKTIKQLLVSTEFNDLDESRSKAFSKLDLMICDAM